MAARDTAQMMAVESGQDADWELFQSIRNTVTRNVKKEKELWQKGKMEICQTNSKDCWKNILAWLGWASTGSPNKLYSGGRMETSPTSWQTS